MLFKDKNGEEIEIPIPEQQRETTYKIIIKKLTKKLKPEITTVYINAKTKRVITDWSTYHNLPDEEKEDFRTTNVPIGSFETSIAEETIYEQEKYDLDVSELAMFVNRTK